MYSINKRILIAGRKEKIFEALTSSEEIPRFWPILEAEIGTAEGERITLKGDGFEDRGTITQFEPNEVFEYRYWSTNHGVPESPENLVTIKYTIVEKGESVEVDVRQENLRSKEMLETMREAWDFLLSNLRLYVEK